MLVTVECLLDKPPSIIVSGMCSFQSKYDGIYEPTQEAASSKWIYRNDNNEYLYFDPGCNGTGSNPNMWIFDSSEPSATAESNLEGSE